MMMYQLWLSIALIGVVSTTLSISVLAKPCYDKDENKIPCPTEKIKKSDDYVKPLFKDNGDFTITGENTGLLWQQYESDQRMTWQEAQGFCRDFDLAGKDWSLPSKEDLMSLVDYEFHQPSINTQFFPKTKPTTYWSNSSHTASSNTAWVVDFSYGYISRYYKGDKYYVRCVNNGQNFSRKPK